MKTIFATAISLALVAPVAAQTTDGDNAASTGTRIQTPQEAVNDASILPPSEADALGRPENELLRSLPGGNGSDEVTTGSVRQPSEIIDDAGTTPSPVIRNGTGAATTDSTATGRPGSAAQGGSNAGSSGSSNGLPPSSGAGSAGAGGAAIGNSAF